MMPKVRSLRKAKSKVRVMNPKPANAASSTMLNLQKELLDAYEQASRAWLARVKSEVDLWSELARKLSTTRSIPEALAAYQNCVVQRMQMAADDGRQLFNECQKITQKINHSLSTGWPTGSQRQAEEARRRAEEDARIAAEREAQRRAEEARRRAEEGH